MKTTLLAVGRVRPPFTEAESHYRKLLGPQTLAHQLARIVLLEQLFRAAKILAGERYHY